MSGWQVTLYFHRKLQHCATSFKRSLRVYRALDKCLIGRGTNNAGYTLTSITSYQATPITYHQTTWQQLRCGYTIQSHNFDTLTCPLDLFTTQVS